ncbi:MAG: type II toxin-antitoxin system PemK/MazF family toxin [Proteobacteria bacterium]|nr:type II toxin-antitoxin system PemK/MazF family toxin [Pseudomonadota bacterium]
MRRGDVITVALQGDFGKPRPAVIVQSDAFNESHATITVVPITSTVIPAPLFRITVDPSPANGLRRVSQVMVDKIVTVRRERVGKAVGALDSDTMARVGRSIALWLELG